MRKTLITAGIFCVLNCMCAAGRTPLYKDSRQPVEARVKDLLQRMTLEEKIAQMNQFVGLEHMKKAEKEMSVEEMKQSHATGFYPGLHSSEVAEMIKKGLIGSFLHVITAREANFLQSLAQQSRLQIPLLTGIDAIHGNGLHRGATIYPTPIGQAASFDDALVEKASRETALEMRASGMHWTFTPNVEVARDARWGRVGETFGEDPHLVGRMGAATVKGFQTNNYADGNDTYNKVIACAKHFIGGSQPVNGINGAPCDISDRTLQEVFMPPFKACLDAGARTFMMAHNELNGVPCHASRFLMTDVLRDRWHFRGFVVSDWLDVERLEDYHRVAPTVQEAYLQSVRAGLDMHMHGPGFVEALTEAVRTGRLSEARIDTSVSAILEAKFRLGLFEQPFVDEKEASKVVFSPEHQATALEMARKSIVLLKNDGLLPLDRHKYRKILVTGPNADNQTILGDWAFEQPDANTTTVLEGLKEVAGEIAPETDLQFYPFHWNLRKMQMSDVQAAVQQAATCDLAIVVVGENSMRYHWQEKTCGENTDRYDLSLVGLQEQLVEEIHATGTPVVVVLVNGRPLSTEWIAEHVPALVEAWEPGSLGGRAVAEILFGTVNPEAKLPITIPRHAGQIPVYYNHKFTSHWFKYATGNSAPLFAFGYGLSYTAFDITAPRLSSETIRTGGRVQVSVDVTNTGERAGSEVVQLYIRDSYASAVRPVKELKAYRKVLLQPGERQTVTFELSDEDLKFYDIDMNYVVEPGEFEIMTGNSSRDADLRKAVLTFLPEGHSYQ
jgi:beta-glucosidase